MISIAETALTARMQVEVSNRETWSDGVMEKNAILQYSSTPILPSMESFQYQRVHTVSVNNGYSVYFGHH